MMLEIRRGVNDRFLAFCVRLTDLGNRGELDSSNFEAAKEKPVLFAIFCIDKPGMAEKRKAVTAAHVEYLGTKPIELVMSGPLTSDDGERVIGSLLVVEADSRAEVEEFQRKDPLVQAELWETAEVRAFNKRIDNRG